MLETIPSLYWMIIIAIPVGFFTFVLYQMGMLLNDSREVVRTSSDILKETEKTISRANSILDQAEGIVTVAKNTVEEVSETIIQPVRGIAGAINVVSSFVSGLKRE